MQIHKAIGMMAALALVAVMISPALACDKSGAKKASAELGQGCASQASATCAKTTGTSSAQAGVVGCASTCGVSGVKQAQAVVCPRSSDDCTRAMRTKYATHGWLGAELQWNEGASGPTVAAVAPDSPADKAGFRVGDVLTSLNGITFAPEQRALLHEFKANAYKIGKTVRYTVRRGAEIVRLNPKLEKIPGQELDRMLAMHVTTQHPTEVASVEK